MANETRERSAIYIDAEQNRLFVPADRMWEIRSAMEPGEVLKRANLSAHKWDRWRNKHGNDHWILKWCYGDEVPAGVRIIQPFEQRPKRGQKSPRVRETPPDAFLLEEGMPQFRKVATARSAEQWAALKVENGKGRHSIFHWLKRYEDQPFFRRWLLHREELPRDLHVARPSEIRACLTAWIPKARYQPAYRIWFDLFPDHQIPEWADWLFGGPVPGGWFVICEWMVELKKQLSPPAVCAASGVVYNSFVKWRDNPTHAAALHQLIKSAARRSPSDDDAASALKQQYAGWNGSQMVAAMKRYAEHATLAAAFLRMANGVETEANRLAGRWRSQLNRAGTSVAEQLKSFVAERPHRDDRDGIVDDSLFLPSESMRKFREAASAQRIHHRLSGLPAECVQLWFLHTVLPREILGRLLIEDGPKIRSALSAPEPDGPILGGGFRWSGDTFVDWEHEGQTRRFENQPHDLVMYLWNAPNMTAEYRDLAAHVWNERELGEETIAGRFGKPRHQANQFFEQNGIPIRVEGSPKRYLAKLRILEKS